MFNELNSNSHCSEFKSSESPVLATEHSQLRTGTFRWSSITACKSSLANPR